MIKKIDQYLLTNYPIIWNLKVVPMALLVIAANILFFALGYLVTDTSVKSDSFIGGAYYLIYAGAILLCILLFIFWLIQYNRNNALKVHYPQSNLSLYLEWVLIFVFCSLICLIPNSLSLGKEAKWKNTISEREYREYSQLLKKVEALLPSDTYSFNLNNRQAPMLVGNAKVDRTKFDTQLYTYIDGETTPNPIEYIGPSLLYFKDNRYYYSDEENLGAITVHQWLVNENKDSIEATMQACLDLIKRHKLKTNVDVETWMKTVYNPPLYPVEELINTNDYSEYNNETLKYIETSKLDSYYYNVNDYYNKKEENNWYKLITFIIALGFSVMVFSARLTSGKAWIFALLSAGVLAFASSLLSGFVAILSFVAASDSEPIAIMLVTPIFWMGLFAIITYLIIQKVMNGKKKGRSNIYINLGIWLIPTIIPTLFYAYIVMITAANEKSADIESGIFYMFIVNIIFTLLAMLPTVILLRKWKALPEQ